MFFEQLKVEENDSHTSEQETVSQSDNPAWFNLRKIHQVKLT